MGTRADLVAWSLLRSNRSVDYAALGFLVRDPRLGGVPRVWLGKDRAMVVFGDAKEIGAKRRLFDSVLKEWIRFV